MAATVISLMRIWPGSRWFVVTSARGVGDGGGGVTVCAPAVAIPAAIITAKATAIVSLDMGAPSGSPFLAGQRTRLAPGSTRTASAAAIGRRRGRGPGGPALLAEVVGPGRFQLVLRHRHREARLVVFGCVLDVVHADCDVFPAHPQGRS